MSGPRCPKGCCSSYVEHIRSIALGTGPTATSVREDKLTTDLAAYRRMRADGLQPKSHLNAGLLEQNAKISQEVEQGILLNNDRMRREVSEAHACAVVTPLVGGDAA